MLRLCLTIWSLMFAVHSYAQRTEAKLITAIVECFQTRDTIGYTKLFPREDSFRRWKPLLEAHASRYKTLPHYLTRDEAAINFIDVFKRGRGEEIHWRNIVLMRYELEEAADGVKLGRHNLPFSVFQGYIFVRDQKTGKVYTMSMANIIVAHGKWYSGEVVSVLQADNKETFLKRLQEEKELLSKMAVGDFLTDIADSTDEDVEKEIIDRKFYKGWFDDEVPIQFYVQYIKGNCPEDACTWDALFKFGEDEWVKMTGAKDSTGKWIFTEERATMELSLDSDIYTGIWSAGPNETEYDASMKEAPISPARSRELDEIIRAGIAPE